MTITILHDNGNRYTWQTGDDPVDLRRMLSILQHALDEVKEIKPLTTALANSFPIEISTQP